MIPHPLRSLLMAGFIAVALACDSITGTGDPFTGLWEGRNDQVELTLHIRQYGDSLTGTATFVIPGFMTDGPRQFVGRAYGDSIGIRWPTPPLTGYSSGNFYGHRTFMSLEGTFRGDSISLKRR